MRRALLSRFPAWLILTLGLALAPAALMAQDDCGYAGTSADYLYARADAVWLGKLERVKQTARSGDGFVSTRSGYFWLKPQTALKGPLPKASWRGEWESTWDDSAGDSGGPPDADELYVVVIYKTGQDIGDMNLYRMPCVAGLETAERPTGPQPKGYDLVLQARQARLAGNHARAFGFIRRVFDNPDAVGAGQAKPQRAWQRADAYLERFLIYRMRGPGKPCDSDLLFAESAVRPAAPDNLRAIELRAEINALITAGGCKPFD